jgi:hypothetical protein
VTFRPNPQFALQLAADAEHRAALERAARDVAREADRFARQAGAPWMPRDDERVTVVDTDGPIRVVATDYGAHLREWGSRNNAPHAPLRRGVRAAGYDLEER